MTLSVGKVTFSRCIAPVICSWKLPPSWQLAFHGKAEIKYLSAVFSDVPSAAITAPGSPAPVGRRDLSHQLSIPKMSHLGGCLNVSVSTCAPRPRHGLQMQNAMFGWWMQPRLLEAQIPPLSRAAGCSEHDSGSSKYLILTLNTFTAALLSSTSGPTSLKCDY